MQKLRFRILCRQFLFRIVDLELLSESAQGDIGKLLGQCAALLIFISVLLALLAGGFIEAPIPTFQIMAMTLEYQHFLIATTMLVVGLFAVLSWDSTFPNLRFLSLKAMHEVVALDPGARTVTVDAGITYGQLGPYLDSKGFALHNLASLPHISIAGACSTATHGSGEKNGNLATAVSAVEIVTASGDLVKLSRKLDGEAFRGAVVGLGALGVIARITLDIQPTYTVRQYVYENLPLAQMKEHFDEIQSSGYSVSLFTDWQRQRLNELWIKSRIGDGQAFAAPPEFFGAKLAVRNLHPIAELSAENCTEQMGVLGPWYERLPHFRMGFTPSAGKELQSEYFVPRRNAVDAILAVERLRDQVTPHLLISEIRAIAADDLWMSTCYHQPSVTIHFTWKPDWPAVRRLLPVIEKELSPFQPRPHWGKLFTLEPAQLRSRYEKLADFSQLATRYDPKGKFRNAFLDANLFVS